jgi:quercetin dioxygenase-like cupin family protein
VNVKHYTTEPVWENPFKLNALKYHDSSEAELLHLTLAGGEQTVRHIPPVDVLLYILEGEPTVEIGDRQQQVATESYLECPAGSVFGVYNRTEDRVRFLIIKTSKTDKPPVILD